MKILAIDTTETACSAALLDGDETLEHFKLTPRRHTEYLLPMLDALLAEAQTSLTEVDGLGFAKGPGSFTGVRIASAAIQGIAVAVDLPIAPVSSLLALAQGAARRYQADHALVALDARMQEVYWAACEQDCNGLMQLPGEEVVCRPDDIPIPASGGWHGIGSGWGQYGKILQSRLDGALQKIHPDDQIHAQDVAWLAKQALLAGQGVSVEHALPVYLRHPVAENPSQSS